MVRFFDFGHEVIRAIEIENTIKIGIPWHMFTSENTNLVDDIKTSLLWDNLNPLLEQAATQMDSHGIRPSQFYG